MIYFSILGTHDTRIDFRNPDETCGSVFTIFRKYADKINTVFLFTTKTGDLGEQKFIDAANETEKAIKQQNRNIHLTQIELDFTPSPIDYDIVYNEMLSKINMILKKNDIMDDEKIINITSGTATMTASWLLLQQSGIIPNAKLVQSFNKDIQRKRGIPCEEVNLKADGFPTILAPDVLAQELNNQIIKNKRLTEDRATHDTHSRFPGLIGKSIAMTDLKKSIERLAPTKNHVLILGEPGTGKELVGKFLHELGDRTRKPFFKINLGGKSSNIIESELFGHKKGAFTDAKTERKGYFLENDGGTIFLDEIGDTSLDIQEKLLRVIEYGELQRLGDDKTFKVDVKIISATNADIASKVKNGEIRQDFLSRLGQLIHIKPLRERRDDIREIIETKFPDLNLSKKCIKELVNENWDGANVRELLTTLKSAETLNQDKPIDRNQIPTTAMDLLKETPDNVALPDLPLSVPLREYIDMIKEKLIMKALEIYPTKVAAAKALNTKVDTLFKRRNKNKKDFS